MADKTGQQLTENINVTNDNYGTVAHVVEIEGEKYFVTETGMVFKKEGDVPVLVSVNSPLPVRDYRSLQGLLANRPAPDAPEVVVGETTYWAVDDGWLYVSDGTEWKQVLEVGTEWV